MVQTTSLAVFCLLLAPSIAVPITNDQHARAEELAERDPAFGSAVPAVRMSSNHVRAGRNAATLLIREDAEEIFQRDLESPESIASLVTRADTFQLTDRDVEFLKDLTAREPNWFRSAFRAARKVATPSNMMRAGKFAASVLFREDAEEISQRDDVIQFTDRDIEYLKDLAARDPNWFHSAFRAVRKVATPSNMMRAGKFAASVLFREDAGEISQRTDEFQLTDREIEYLKDLSARDPNWFNSAVGAVRRVATPSNMMKAGKFAANLLLREDAEEIAQRDVEYPEDLSTREPKSFFQKVKEFFNPASKNKKKDAEAANTNDAREDAEEFAERDFDFEEEDELSARELEDLEDLAAREPRRSGSFKSKKAKKNSKSEVEGREDDDVFERYFADYEIDDLN